MRKSKSGCGWSMIEANPARLYARLTAAPASCERHLVTKVCPDARIHFSSAVRRCFPSVRSWFHRVWREEAGRSAKKRRSRSTASWIADPGSCRQREDRITSRDRRGLEHGQRLGHHSAVLEREARNGKRQHGCGHHGERAREEEARKEQRRRQEERRQVQEEG